MCILDAAAAAGCRTTDRTDLSAATTKQQPKQQQQTTATTKTSNDLPFFHFLSYSHPLLSFFVLFSPTSFFSLFFSADVGDGVAVLDDDVVACCSCRMFSADAVVVVLDVAAAAVTGCKTYALTNRSATTITTTKATSANNYGDSDSDSQNKQLM